MPRRRPFGVAESTPPPSGRDRAVIRRSQQRLLGTDRSARKSLGCVKADMVFATKAPLRWRGVARPKAAIDLWRDERATRPGRLSWTYAPEIRASSPDGDCLVEKFSLA